MIKQSPDRVSLLILLPSSKKINKENNFIIKKRRKGNFFHGKLEMIETCGEIQHDSIRSHNLGAKMDSRLALSSELCRHKREQEGKRCNFNVVYVRTKG